MDREFLRTGTRRFRIDDAVPDTRAARAIVTYSESTDPENPHYADMTRLFSQSGWVKLPFKEGDIRRDPELVVIKLNAPR